MEKPNAVICGEIHIAEEYDPAYYEQEGRTYDGPINKYGYSLLIQFPDAESIRKAIADKKVEFTFMGE